MLEKHNLQQEKRELHIWKSPGNIHRDTHIALKVLKPKMTTIVNNLLGKEYIWHSSLRNITIIFRGANVIS